VKKSNRFRIKTLSYQGYADAAQEPWFTTSPSKAIPKALNKAGMKITMLIILNLMKHLLLD
jgi:acetyl-CoA C-acetyltransferase